VYRSGKYLCGGGQADANNIWNADQRSIAARHAGIDTNQLLIDANRGCALL
jgi:hypothetical protein